MTKHWRSPHTLVLLVVLLTGCAPNNVPAPAAPQTDCGIDDPRVGQTAVLHGYFHGVQGTARIVSNCEIVIEHFYYDNIGLDVRVVGMKNNDWTHMVPLTKNIRDNGPYTDATLTIPLPTGVTLDDVEQVSINCVSYGINFGDGTFR